MSEPRATTTGSTRCRRLGLQPLVQLGVGGSGYNYWFRLSGSPAIGRHVIVRVVVIIVDWFFGVFSAILADHWNTREGQGHTAGKTALARSLVTPREKQHLHDQTEKTPLVSGGEPRELQHSQGVCAMCMMHTENAATLVPTSPDSL